MKHIVIITILYFFINQNLCGQTKIYYDQDWKTSQKENAHFYRLIDKKNDSLFYVKDFYINNTLQMDGHFSNLDKEVLEGCITWYNKEGKITNSETYTKGVLNGTSTVYLANGKVDYVNEYKDGKIYDGVDIGVDARYVYKKGKLVKKIGYNPPNEYYILSTRIYGVELDSIYWYTAKGKELGLGVYKDNEIEDGLDVKNGFSNIIFTNYKKGKKEGVQKVFGTHNNLLSEKEYVKGLLVLDKTLNPLTGKIVECIYKNDTAFQGSFFEYNPMYKSYKELIFKEGKLITKNKYLVKEGKIELSESVSF